jgi:putative heme-binding domain-containing protein
LLLPLVKLKSFLMREGALLALRRTGDAEARTAIPGFLRDPSWEVRRMAIQWVGEDRLKEYADQVTVSVTESQVVTRELVLAFLATRHLLAGGKSADEPYDEKYIAKVVQDPEQRAEFRAVALQMLRPNHPALSAANLRAWIDSKEPALRWQAARTLAMRADNDSQEQLRQLAVDGKEHLRALAVLGLGHSAAASAETRAVLLKLLDEPALRRDALRSLREAAAQPGVEKTLLAWSDKAVGKTERPTKEERELAEQLFLAFRASKSPDVEKQRKMLTEIAGTRPKNEADWRAALKEPGDPAAGERVFFHVHGPRCYVCHRAQGRGGAIGPDLSTIGAAMNRERHIESILTPSKEIAPQFTTWSITTRDGKVHVGVIVDEGPNSTVTLADNQGKLEVLKRQDIEEKNALPTSIMPDNLTEQMTRQEFRDLLRYLETLR